MTSELYQDAKRIFARLIELDAQQRDTQLEELAQTSPELAREVRSLLDYHTAQSLVVPPANPRIRTKSTLSTTAQSSSLSWVYPPLKNLLVAVPVILCIAGLSMWLHQQVRQSISASVSTFLNESVDHRLAELRQWEQQQLSEALAWSRHPDVVSTVSKLVKEIQEHSADAPEFKEALANTPHTQQLEQHLARLRGGPVKFAVWDRRMLTIADWNQRQQPEVLGEFVTPRGASLLAPVLKGNPKLVLPRMGNTISSGVALEASEVALEDREAVVSIFVPVYDPSSTTVVAALMVRGYGLEQQYTNMLESWSTAAGTETYLLSIRGALLTTSRYGDQLDALALANDESTSKPLPLIRDPGVNLLRGERAEFAAAAWPPTLLARQVTSGNNGMNLGGYRNYVGQPVVGAWRWLPDHQVGIALEQDYDVAFGIMRLVEKILIASNLLCLLGMIGVAVLASFTSLGKRRLRDISEVGPYQVQELLGEGGMGRVYLAEHALLCRQSAVKVLTKGLSDLSVISRFEREVQLASQLTHPNTISIYDFGRNKDGVFYYAMEYINGAHLGQLVEYAGPIDPGRCIFILRQLCRALLEAHQAGVVHRDIKPQNIMVCNRGGEPDFVKLFDYGLVKAFAPGVSHNSSQTRIVVGTPRFMAPERLNSPWLADPRVDVYSVGALAYFLLTAQLPPLVTVGDNMDNEQTGVETLDLPPAVVDFGGLLSICMAVEPSMRPSSMSSLTRELDQLAEKFTWTREDSAEWWSKHESKLLHLVHNKRKKLLHTDASEAS